MAAEKYSTSLVSSQLVDSGPLALPQGYYRSKLFIIPSSANVLVASAGPLLSIIERLCLSTSLPPIEHIRNSIDHELLAFHSKLTASQYPEHLTQVAHYLMSVTLDEILGKNYMRVYQVAAEFKAFTPLSNNDIPPQVHFFDIINHIKERPNQYLDLIELVYFFLIAGFEGQYHLKAEGRQALDNQIEELYQIIQQHRFNKPHRLFNENPLPKPIKNSYKAVLLTAVAAVAVVIVAFFTSHMLLEHKAKKVLFGHSQLALLDN
jgi:type IV/VI secretion system ImpK/VasF family protein